METIIIAIVLFLLVFFLKHGLFAVKMTKREGEAEKEILSKMLEHAGKSNTIRVGNKDIFKILEITESQHYNLFIKQLSLEDDFAGVAIEGCKKWLIPFCLEDIENILERIGTFKKISNYKNKKYEKWVIETTGTYYAIIAVFYDEYIPFLVYGTIDK